MMVRFLSVLLAIVMTSGSVAAADVEGLTALNARVIEVAGRPVALVDVDNTTGALRSVVGVRVGRSEGVLEIRGSDGWETVPSLRVPSHAQLLMDAERGPRVRLPAGGDRASMLAVEFDDGTVAEIPVQP